MKMANTKLLYECSSPFDNKSQYRNGVNAFKIEDVSKGTKISGWNKVKERFLTKKLKPISNEMIILEKKPKEVLVPEIETVQMLSIPKPVNLIDIQSNQVLIKKKNQKEIIPIIETGNFARPVRINYLNDVQSYSVPNKRNHNVAIPFENNQMPVIYAPDSYRFESNNQNPVIYAPESYRFESNNQNPMVYAPESYRFESNNQNLYYQQPKNQTMFSNGINSTNQFENTNLINSNQSRYFYMQSNQPIFHPPSEITVNTRDQPQQPYIIYNIIQDPKNSQQLVQPFNSNQFEKFENFQTPNSMNFRGTERNIMQPKHEINPQFIGKNYKITRNEINTYEEHLVDNEIHDIYGRSRLEAIHLRHSNCPSSLWLSLLGFMILLLQGLLFGLLISKSKFSYG